MSKSSRWLFAAGLFTILVGLLLGLVPHTEHVAAIPSNGTYVGSPERDVYCGSPWVESTGVEACPTDFGVRPQMAMLFLALGGLTVVAVVLANSTGLAARNESD